MHAFDHGHGGWSRAEFESSLGSLCPVAEALDADERTSLLGALLQAWRDHGRALPPPARRDLLALAAAWDAWPLAHRVGIALEAEAALEHADAQHLLSACMQVGDTMRARQLSLRLRLQLLHPHDAWFASQHVELLAWLRWRERGPLPAPDDAGLALEPLAHHHGAGFAWQYHDPAIASLCCLPRFADADEWHGWLDEVYGQGQRPFAVLHRDWGLVGMVNLALYGDVGFFYYWLGPDFQGRGIGPRAVRMLLRFGREELGMRCCYAKVFDHNQPSRRALAKLGFADLDMRGAAPDEAEMFYRWGAPCSRAFAAAELHGLLDRMGSGTRAAVPLLRLIGEMR